MPETGRTRCHCARLPGFPCKAAITQEDLLCDTCRDKNCCVMTIGGETLGMHQQGPVIDWGPVPADWHIGRAEKVSFTVPLDSPNTRIALGGDGVES